MAKKKIVYTYTDRLDRKQKSPNSIFPRKINGDTSSDSYEANSNINQRNGFSQQILDQNLNKNIVRKIGNDFVINDIRSSNDNEHYFYGAKKTIDLKFKVFSATFGTPDQFTTLDVYSASVGAVVAQANAVAAGPDGSIYACGYEPSGSDAKWLVRKRTPVRGDPFISVDSYTANTVSAGVNQALCVAVSPLDGAVYVGGAQVNAGSSHGYLRRSATGASGTFSGVFSLSGTGGRQN